MTHSATQLFKHKAPVGPKSSEETRKPKGVLHTQQAGRGAASEREVDREVGGDRESVVLCTGEAEVQEQGGMDHKDHGNQSHGKQAAIPVEQLQPKGKKSKHVKRQSLCGNEYDTTSKE